MLYYMLNVLSDSSKDLKSLKLSYLRILIYHVFPCSEFIQKFAIFSSEFVRLKGDIKIREGKNF